MTERGLPVVLSVIAATTDAAAVPEGVWLLAGQTATVAIRAGPPANSM
ncbi:MAG: hypothetical protein QOF90_934 [Acetobacteraceae bacterium]|jgi:hypothetical protein|nr:hypothetical protein [Acetobacteraceae bacterium]